MHVLSIAVLLLQSSVQVPRLAHLMDIGCESCTGAALFSRVQALAVAPDRRIVVVDRSEPHVRIFDPTGRPERVFARTGQGPAELQTPVSVSASADGTVEVVDMTLRRLVRFGPTGEDKGSVTLPGFANIGAFAPQGGHALVAITASSSPVLRLMRVTADRPAELIEVGDQDFPQRPPGKAEALPVATAPDGSFVVGDGVGAYVIRRYRRDGTPAGETRRDIPRVRRTPEETHAETARRDTMAAAMRAQLGGGGPIPGFPRAAIPAERTFFDAYALRFDESGRLWVRVERAPPGRTVFDVFDPAGRYLGEVALPVAIKDFALGAGRLAAVVADDLGVEIIRVWTVGA
jgi:hypothetical protein